VFIPELSDFSQVLASDGRDLLISAYSSPRSICSGLLVEGQGLHYRTNTATTRFGYVKCEDVIEERARSGR
jgi:hypothetical protein